MNFEKIDSSENLVLEILSTKLTALLGFKGWIEPEDCQPWQRDWLDRYSEVPLDGARPKSTADVLRLCCFEGVPVVPQGGNTGLVGVGVLGKPGGVILSLSRMNAISPSDLSGGSISMEAGVIPEQLHQSLEGTGLMFLMHAGSEGNAQVGELIVTNAGGSHAFRYGMMQEFAMGLEVVLADGAVWNGMRAVQKDDAGYQLRKLFYGSEGARGTVTRASLTLSAEPKQQLTALLAVRNASGLVKLTTKLRAEGGEFLDRANDVCSEVLKGVAINAFGYLGDAIRDPLGIIGKERLKRALDVPGTLNPGVIISHD